MICDLKVCRLLDTSVCVPIDLLLLEKYYLWEFLQSSSRSICILCSYYTLLANSKLLARTVLYALSCILC